MADDATLKVLEAEEARLQAELEKTPAYKRLVAIQVTIAAYRNNPEASPVHRTHNPAPPVQQPVRASDESDQQAPRVTKIAQVEAAVSEYLVQKGRRATSGEVLPVVLAKGIEMTGKIPSKTLASYLSNSKRFDNIPGFGGYGLVEWNGRRGAPSTGPESSPSQSGQLPLNS